MWTQTIRCDLSGSRKEGRGIGNEAVCVVVGHIYSLLQPHNTAQWPLYIWNSVQSGSVLLIFIRAIYVCGTCNTAPACRNTLLSSSMLLLSSLQWWSSEWQPPPSILWGVRPPHSVYASSSQWCSVFFQLPDRPHYVCSVSASRANRYFTQYVIQGQKMTTVHLKYNEK